MSLDSPVTIAQQRDGLRAKIALDFEWAMLTETIKEPGGMDRLRIALQDDGPRDDNETKTDTAGEPSPGNGKPKEIIP